MNPKILDRLVLVYGLLLIALGAYGYLNNGSVVSLIAGGTAGLLVLVFLAITPRMRQLGRIGVAVISLLLLGQFGRNSFKALNAPADGQAVWHVYTIAIASAIVFLALGAGHMMAMKERRSGGK